MRLGDTPVLIPNTMVKTQAAEGTILETVWESRWLPDSHGGIAQLGEHLPCKQGVKGSNPSISIACIARIQDANLGSTASSVIALHANAFEFTTA